MVKIKCLHHPDKDVEVKTDGASYVECRYTCVTCIKEHKEFYLSKEGRAYTSEEECKKQKDSESSKLSGDDLRLEDWKITKDRIAHFNGNLLRLRVEGIPIATAIQAAAFIVYKDIPKEPLNFFIFQFPSPINLIFLSSALYLVPILLLDLFYFKMLLLSIQHAIDIERIPAFYGKISITRTLTSKRLTIAHRVGAYTMYAAIIAVGVYLAFSFRPTP